MRSKLFFLILSLLLMGACQQSASVPAPSGATEASASPAESVLAAEETPAPTPEGICLAGRIFSGRETELQAVLDAEDLAALDRFPDLISLDLSGSACYESILAYQASHPHVSVRYTVSLDGQEVPFDAEELTLSRLSDPSLLAYLPRLKALSVTEPLTMDQLEALQSAAPEVRLTYRLSFAGRTADCAETCLDLSDVSPEHVAECARAVLLLPDLLSVQLDPAAGTSPWTLEDAGRLVVDRPDLEVHYTAAAFGITFSLTDEVVSFSGVDLSGRVEELRRILPYMAHVGRLDMENCNVPDEQLAALREDFPAPRIVWRVTVKHFSCRTDAVMIRFVDGYEGRRLTDDDVGALKYCNEVRYLDLGHSLISDAWFTAYMPELEVCILAVGKIADISALQNCPKLEYLEIFHGRVTDISPLRSCKNLKHLNICNNRIADISPLFELDLERLWMSRNPIPREQISEFRSRFPDCAVNTSVSEPTAGGWRRSPRYDLLYLQFCYAQSKITSFSAFDMPEALKLALGDQ